MKLNYSPSFQITILKHTKVTLYYDLNHTTFLKDFFFNYKEQKALVYEFILSVIPFPVILIPQEQCRDK